MIKMNTIFVLVLFKLTKPRMRASIKAKLNKSVCPTTAKKLKINKNFLKFYRKYFNKPNNDGHTYFLEMITELLCFQNFT